jgi:hypothetical protein
LGEGDSSIMTGLKLWIDLGEAADATGVNK